MSDFEVTPRTKLKRAPKRGHFDRETVYAILDETLVCHVGFVTEGRPFVIPTNCWREGDRLYVHGARTSRLMKVLVSGAEVSVAVTLLDGLVLARSAFHHSVNYRSVVMFGRAEPVEEPEAKNAALRAFIERVAPGRWDQIRPPTATELKATAVAALPLTEVSAKIRSGPPIDDEEDYALPVWAGVVPLTLGAGKPQPDPRMAPDTALPDYVSQLPEPATSR